MYDQMDAVSVKPPVSPVATGLERSKKPTMSHPSFARGLHWLKLPDAEAVAQQATHIVAEQLAHKPNASLVFPTGSTPLGMYAQLRQRNDINWEKSRLFQLDEYVRPDFEGPLPYQTFAEFMQNELWRFVGGQKFYMAQYFECPAAYEALVTKDNGPDLVILGIGKNGHIAFNEPGSQPDSPSRIVDLAPLTRISNFADPSQPGLPTQAITLGLKAILSARHILMLATGTGKQGIVATAFDPNTAPDINCPASWLKQHPHVTLLTDF
jgi:glucosamine-6-phosphate deaminase